MSAKMEGTKERERVICKHKKWREGKGVTTRDLQHRGTVLEYLQYERTHTHTLSEHTHTLPLKYRETLDMQIPFISLSPIFSDAPLNNLS